MIFLKTENIFKKFIKKVDAVTPTPPPHWVTSLMNSPYAQALKYENRMEFI